MLRNDFIIMLIALACILSGCATLPKAFKPELVHSQESAQATIYILNHGWHTGIALKAQDLNKMIPALASRFPDAQYYEVGWGDKGFYQSHEITTKLTLRAMFWSSGSVLHVVGIKESPAEYFTNSKIRTLVLPENYYQNLLKFIHSSFKVDDSDNIVAIKEGIYGDSQFYEAIGRYQILNTCNKWTAKLLYSAGMDIDTSLKLTASSVIDFIDKVCAKEHRTGELKFCH